MCPCSAFVASGSRVEGLDESFIRLVFLLHLFSFTPNLATLHWLFSFKFEDAGLKSNSPCCLPGFHEIMRLPEIAMWLLKLKLEPVAPCNLNNLRNSEKLKICGNNVDSNFYIWHLSKLQNMIIYQYIIPLLIYRTPPRTRQVPPLFALNLRSQNRPSSHRFGPQADAYGHLQNKTSSCPSDQLGVDIRDGSTALETWKTHIGKKADATLEQSSIGQNIWLRFMNI